MITRNRVEALHQAMHDACFAPGDAAAADLEALTQGSGVHPQDRAALRGGPHRYPLYRKLVRGTLDGVSGAILARARAHLDAAAPGLWEAALDAYLVGPGPRTPHLRDVPRELSAVLIPMLDEAPAVPRYVTELLRFELAELAMGSLPDPPDLEVGEIDAGLPLALRAPCVRLRVGHPVHELSTDVPASVAAQDTRLFLYRTAEHEVMSVVLSPFADELLARALEGRPLGAAIGEAAEALAVPVSEGLLTEVARWLADFGARGVVLGARVGGAGRSEQG